MHANMPRNLLEQTLLLSVERKRERCVICKETKRI